MRAILQITNYNGKLCAICNVGEPVPIDEIKGSPRQGGGLTDDNVAFNGTIDETCLNGVCDWSTDERTE